MAPALIVPPSPADLRRVNSCRLVGCKPEYKPTAELRFKRVIERDEFGPLSFAKRDEATPLPVHDKVFAEKALVIELQSTKKLPASETRAVLEINKPDV